MTTQTITEFLTARLDEDEAAAREAIAERRRVSRDGDKPDYYLLAWPDLGRPAVLVGPERVLREVAAKRRVVERHSPVPLGPRAKKGTPHSCAGCNFEYGDIASVTEDISECPELRDLAAVYSDHEDYQAEWRP